MSNNLQLLKEAIFKFPSVLADYDNESITKYINYQLPYSVGFEVECNSADNFNSRIFENIPNIIHVDCDDNEKRFRIPAGLKGLICLQTICENLAEYCTLNMGSGIHYHIDMTDTFHLINKDSIEKNNNFIIDELIKWETAKELNEHAKCRLDCRGWVNFQSGFKTCEIRIGEMTFDYEIILKRMIDACRIVRILNHKLTETPIETRLSLLEKELKTLDIDTIKKPLPNQIELKSIINKRTIKINGN